MVNLRYHIVSIVAVFLALAVGIVVGSTVVDRAIVNSLNDRLDAVEARANATSAENRRLGDDLDELREFAEEARDRMVSGVLQGRPVLLVTVQGVDRAPLEALVEALEEAEAQLVGTLSFTPEMSLEREGSVPSLAQVLDVSPTLPEGLRRVALLRVAAILAGGATDPGLLPGLADAGFVSFEEAPDQGGTGGGGPERVSLASFPLDGLSLVVVSGAGAAVADGLLAQVLTVELAQVATEPAVVAAEVVGEDLGPGRTFVPSLRGDGSVAARLSTVDNLASPAGQAAAVLALRDLAVARTGHYGAGPGAQRQLPSTST